MGAAITYQALSAFQKSFRGRLIRPSDEDYDVARALYNGMIDKRPRLIARCVDVADIITAVNFGREQGLLFAIRGGAHNGPGLGSCDDGMVIAAAEVVRETLGLRTSPMEQTYHEKCVASARAVLGEITFGKAWAEGRAMTLEQAIEYALATANN